MKRLSDSDLEMMDYLDGTLAPERAAAVEARLAQNPEDSQLLADLKLAQSTLHEMSEAEPIRARDDFWQNVKAELPAQRKKSFLAQLGGWLAPPQRKMGMSVGLAAAVVAIVTMMATLFGPAQTQTYANNTASQALSQQQRDQLDGRVPPKRDAKPLPGASDSGAEAESADN